MQKNSFLARSWLGQIALVKSIIWTATWWRLGLINHDRCDLALGFAFFLLHLLFFAIDGNRPFGFASDFRNDSVKNLWETHATTEFRHSGDYFLYPWMLFKRRIPETKNKLLLNKKYLTIPYVQSVKCNDTSTAQLKLRQGIDLKQQKGTLIDLSVISISRNEF